MPKLTRVSVSLEDALLRRFDARSAREGYPTRSEAIKAVMRGALVEEEWAANQEVAGAITVVYDHHRGGMVARLTDVQHDFGGCIVSAQHVHLDRAHCLEVIVVKGPARRIRELLAGLKAVKGLKHSAMVRSSLGRLLG